MGTKSNDKKRYAAQIYQKIDHHKISHVILTLNHTQEILSELPLEEFQMSPDFHVLPTEISVSY